MNYLRQISTVPTGENFSPVLEDQASLHLHHSLGGRSSEVDEGFQSCKISLATRLFLAHYETDEEIRAG